MVTRQMIINADKLFGSMWIQRRTWIDERWSQSMKSITIMIDDLHWWLCVFSKSSKSKWPIFHFTSLQDTALFYSRWCEMMRSKKVWNWISWTHAPSFPKKTGLQQNEDFEILQKIRETTTNTLAQNLRGIPHIRIWLIWNSIVDKQTPEARAIASCKFHIVQVYALENHPNSFSEFIKKIRGNWRFYSHFVLQWNYPQFIVL